MKQKQQQADSLSRDVNHVKDAGWIKFQDAVAMLWNKDTRERIQVRRNKTCNFGDRLGHVISAKQSKLRADLVFSQKDGTAQNF